MSAARRTRLTAQLDPKCHFAGGSLIAAAVLIACGSSDGPSSPSAVGGAAQVGGAGTMQPFAGSPSTAGGHGNAAGASGSETAGTSASVGGEGGALGSAGSPTGGGSAGSAGSNGGGSNVAGGTSTGSGATIINDRFWKDSSGTPIYS
ncbi:MAG: hypothetical protein ABUL62_33610 [Myxococcales bacterium]